MRTSGPDLDCRSKCERGGGGGEGPPCDRPNTSGKGEGGGSPLRSDAAASDRIHLTVFDGRP